jgi:L-fuconolactonase
MKIDAHVHIWDLSQAEYAWLSACPPVLNRTVTLAEVEPELSRAGLDSCVLVQAADHAADTDHMLAVARSSPIVSGVVGWLPLDEPATVEAAMESWATEPLLVGVRSLIHDRSDPRWILRPEVIASLDVLSSRGIPFDFVCSHPGALRLVLELAEVQRDLTIVIDHLGKPPVAGGSSVRGEWDLLMRSVAECPRMVAKVSGLYDGGEPSGWTAADYLDIVTRAVELFGADRLMYGSDWPMSILAGGYTSVWIGLDQAFAGLSEPERRAVLGGTAERIYKLSAKQLPPAESPDEQHS